MKRVFVLVLAVLLSVGMLSACSNQQTDSAKETVAESEASDQQKEPDESEVPLDSPATIDEFLSNETVSVMDRNSQKLGEVKRYGTVTITDSGIFYTALPEDAQDDTTRDFYLYQPLENRTLKLGTITDMSYEAVYARTEVNQKLYTLVIRGNMFDDKKDPLWLLEFDLANGRMEQYKISENGFAYTAMTAVNDKLLIINHDQQDVLYDRLYEFDTKHHGSRQVLQVKLENGGGETLRQVAFDGEKIYLLRLYLDEQENVKAFVDTFTTDYEEQGQQEITGMMVEASSELLLPDEIFQEMRQMVSRFVVYDGRYMYYENFSITHFFGDLTTGKLSEESSDALTASFGSGKPFYFLHRLLLTEKEAPKDQPVEWMEWKDEGFSVTAFSPADSRYYLDTASCSPNGSTLLTVQYKNPENPLDVLPTLLYYFPPSE